MFQERFGQRGVLEPELYVGGVSQLNRTRLTVVSLLCSVIGWELPRERRGLTVDSMELEGWLLGLSVKCAPTVGDLSSTFSQLPIV